MSKTQQVCIIGAGRLGQAFATLIRSQQLVKVTLWDQDKSLVANEPSLVEQLQAADLVILAVPTNAIRPVVATITPDLPDRTGVLLVSKGLEKDTGLTAAEIATKIIPTTRPWAVFGGPMIAEELLAGVKGTGVIAGDNAVEKIMADIFPQQIMNIELAKNPQDVSMCGVLKNIYALIFGLVSGMNWPPVKMQEIWNMCSQDFLTTAGLMGIDQATAAGPAGLGDFRMTAGSPHSRNRQAGVMIVTKHEFDPGAEAINAWPMFWARFTELHQVPLLLAMQNIFDHQVPASVLNEAFSTILKEVN